MLNLEQKLKKLDEAKEKLDKAIALVFEAGSLYDETATTSTQNFYKERWTLAQLEEQVKTKMKELRLEKEI